MRIRQRYWAKVLVVIVALLTPVASVMAAVDTTADTILSYATIEPGRIKLGDSADIRVTTLYGTLKSVPLPTVPGLDFEITGRAQGFDFISGRSVPATFIMIRVTPKFAGVFTIPALTPGSKTLG